MSLVVVALGGNAISPPAGDLSPEAERAVLASTVAELAPIAREGHRLLLVHGNGPQVGRLLAAQPGQERSLDVLVAQTQGELGYLLATTLDRALGRDETVALVTRVLVDPDDPAFSTPTKPIGAILPAPPADGAAAPTPDGRGWRRVVASPRPRAVVELDAVRTLLGSHHVVAGGGGGVPLGLVQHDPRAAVIDKDWVAALLAIALDADELVFVTDVSHAFDEFQRPGARAIGTMTLAEAHERLGRGVFAAGSMAPKVESAVSYTAATGRAAVITSLGAVAAGRRGSTGTTVVA